MNVLRDLEARLRSQPDQQRLGRQRELFRNTKAKATDRLETIRTEIRKVRAIRTIDGNSRLLAEEEAALMSSVRLCSSELTSLLGKTSPSANLIGAQLDAIQRATVALAKSVDATWESVRRPHLDRAAALAPLAEKVSPSTLGPLQVLRQLLHSLPTPPTSSSGVQSLLAAIAQFNAAIQQMNIDGAVGQFLRDASTTGADPKALFQPEIKKYLDEHPQLWAALRVGLK